MWQVPNNKRTCLHREQKWHGEITGQHGDKEFAQIYLAE
jgi:hypothetical protein